MLCKAVSVQSLCNSCDSKLFVFWGLRYNIVKELLEMEHMLSWLFFICITFQKRILITVYCNVLEMVTVCTSPSSQSAVNSVDVQTETDYLKIAKKGGGHKG